MNTVLYCSANGAIYETHAFTKADIDQLVTDQGLECLTSADRQFDFWFSPVTPGCQRRVNQSATELLLATTPFTAGTVPLLHGAVVVATHDADGDLDGLSWEQLDLLARKNQSLTKRDERTLERRIARATRPQKRRAPKKTSQPALVSCAHPRTAVSY
ncbi:hypothetical protein [Mycolicibacterium sediminis]|uniref:Uncharacterized protein n=1 Tax=Mycolicibacterium sediminis TaxID=1286180 RepID=A0A7I7QLG0_9MYCO|nr:hypothetical protein [Mycolicibacterium sediminis]BBY26827.1 hypothetical protein MSEDJ_09230 [Mycolicibacterium sediminis]